MPNDLICPHCLRAVRTTGEGDAVARRCTTCGKPLFRAESAVPRATKVRPGMKGRDDDDYEEEYYEDERPSRRGARRSRSGEKPGKVQAIAIMMLIGGILACLGAAGYFAYIGLMAIGTLGFGLVCCLWPGPYYGAVVGIMAIIKGSQLLGQQGHLQAPPKTMAIMMIVNIVNFDIPNCVMGILILVFCSDPEVENYYRG